MNATRRKRIQEAIEQLDELKTIIEELHDEEQEAYDNLPESFQESERGEAMDAVADNLDSAMSSMEEVLDSLNAAIE